LRPAIARSRVNRFLATEPDKGAYHLYLLETEAPIGRLKPTGSGDEVRLGYWSHRRRWEDVDDMGGVVLPLDEALEFIANEGVLWTWA
jgi:hypothetical protein